MKILSILAVSITVATLAAPVEAETYIKNGYIEKALVEVCTETADDNRVGLNKTLKSHRLSKHAVVAKVVCNGEPLTQFARSRQAYNVAAMLQPYEERLQGNVTIKDVAAAAN